MDLKLITLLTGELENLCLIADNDQSIYAFRGAEIEEVMNMRRIFPKMKVHVLNTNYRSTQTIVEASKSLIDRNTKLIDKKLHSNNEEGNPIIVFNEGDASKEAQRVVNIIRMSTQKYGMSYKDIAILYRMNFLSRAVEDALLKFRIPYKIIGGTNFYARKEIKDVMSYFRFILNPYDTVAFTRAISSPKRGIGEKTIEKIVIYAINNECDLLTATEEVCQKGKAKIGAQEFIDIINELAANIEVITPEESLREMLRLTGYAEHIYKSEPEDVAEDRIQNIQELLNIAIHFETMDDLSSNITLDASAETNEEDDNCVQLLTMHSSKGLEFNMVIIVGSVEGVIPSYRAKTSREIEEERRLMYVAMTRAKKLLFITRPEYVTKQGTFVKAKQSRFIGEINSDYIYQYAQ